MAARQHVTWGNVRLATLAAVLAAAYGAFGAGLFSGWWLAAPAAAFFWAGGRLEQAVNARARLGRSVAFYERALARLDGRWVGTGGDTGARFLDDDHLYARDLDLFGDGSLFELLSAARTRIGEQTLAAWLREAADPSTVRARQAAVTELSSRTDLREDLAVLGEDARSGVDAEALAAWGEAPRRLDSLAAPVWAWPLSAVGALAAVALFTWLTAWFGLLQLDDATLATLRGYGVSVFALCGLVTWRFRERTSGIFRDVDEAAHDLALLAGVLGRLEQERFTAPRLAVLRTALDVDGQPPSRRIARLNALMSLVDSRDHLIVRLAGILVLWDVHLAHAIERWRRSSGPAVRRWLAAVGEMEALLSLAGYRHEHRRSPDAGRDRGGARRL
jgi:hypothetical protein